MEVKEGFLEAERYQLEGAGIGQVVGWLGTVGVTRVTGKEQGVGLPRGSGSKSKGTE